MSIELVELCRDAKNKIVVNLHGATLQSWIHDGTEMIFVSKKAVFDNKKAVRGGIPVVFPCFGAWELGPQHGFARISKWNCSKSPTTGEDGDVSATFSLSDTETTRTMWNGNKFEVNYIVTVKSTALVTELNVKNLNDAASFDFTCLLHTYFSLPDVSKTTISGLGALKYIDKVDKGSTKEETEDPKTINKFTDSVYMDALKEHVITNAAGGKTVCIKKSNFPDTVVWNPWEEKACGMSDFGDDEYLNMDHHKAISWWTPITGMGSALSAREQKDLKPHLQGIEPSSLAAVIWDSINSVGIDDEVEIFGVHFLNGTEFEDGGQARVIFWDEIGAHDMPRKVFLEILLMMGNEIAQEYEDKYDLELSIDLGIAVRKLQVALVSLRETLDGLTDDQCAKTYRERLDSGVSMNEDSISDELVEEVRTRHGSYMWTDSDQESEAAYGGRRQSKGIESVFERLPDLKRRYENAISSSNSSKKPLERVRQRIKILNMFQKGSVAPSAILEEEEHASRAPSPNPMRRRSTLGMSSVQRSRSNSVCSYDSVSSSKQLLLPDSPPPVPSMPSMRKSTPVDPQDQDSSSSSSLA